MIFMASSVETQWMPAVNQTNVQTDGAKTATVNSASRNVFSLSA